MSAFYRVPFPRGVQLCEQYGVTEYMRPLLELDTTQSKELLDNTPTKAQMKRQAMADKRTPGKSTSQLPLKRKNSFKNDLVSPANMPLQSGIRKRRRTGNKIVFIFYL